MKQFQFKLVTIDGVELRDPGSKGLSNLNALGAEGWQIVHVRDDPQHTRDLLVFLEREEILADRTAARGNGAAVVSV